MVAVAGPLTLYRGTRALVAGLPVFLSNQVRLSPAQCGTSWQPEALLRPTESGHRLPLIGSSGCGMAAP